MGDERERWREARGAWERLTSGHPVGSGADALAALGDVGMLRRLLDEVELEAVRTARRHGSSWAEIAVKLGVTRQSAWERWRELDAPADRPVEASRASAEADAGGLLGEAVRAMHWAARVIVPDVVGLSYAAAQRRLTEVGLVGILAAPDGPQAAPADPERAVVTDQTPESGATALPGAPVQLWIDPGGGSGVREPRRPNPTPRLNRQAEEPADRAAG
ncbi:MAG TPA: PASTA domain-containing protein [Pseudonocardia sp.]|jgi:hypothetical protein|nr:PASTA domain-containing protein [Pseudonocardia sp.]